MKRLNPEVAKEIERQNDLLDLVLKKIQKYVPLEETDFFEITAIRLSEELLCPYINEIEEKCDKSKCLKLKYFYPSNFNPPSDQYFTGKTLRDLYKAKDENRLKPLTYQSKPTWSLLAISVNYFGWKGYVEGLTIEDGIKKFPANRKGQIHFIKEKNERSTNNTWKSKIYVGMLLRSISIGIVSILILGLLLTYTLPYYNPFPDNENGILILPIQRDNDDNFRSDLYETLKVNLDKSLNIEVRKFDAIINTLLKSKYTESQVDRIGKAQNAKIVVWGELISNKNKFWPKISIVKDDYSGFFNRDLVEMDYLYVADTVLPPVLVDKPEVIIKFINGLINFKLGNFQDALDLFLEVEKQISLSEVKSNSLLVLIGGCYISVSTKDSDETNLQKAEEYFLKTISLFPDSRAAYNNLAGVYLKKKEYVKALDYSYHLVKNELATDNTWYQIGLVYYHLDSLDKAIEYFEKARGKAPNIYRYYSMIGSCYKRKGEHDLAIEYLQKSIDINKNDLEAIYEMGMCYFFKGDMQEAEYFLTKVVAEKGPSHYKAMVALAGVYDKTDPEKAKMYYTAANKINNTSVEINLKIGNIYENLGNSDSAIFYYNKALALDSSRYEPWIGLGLIFDKKLEYKKAIHYLSNAVSLNDNQHSIWYRLGINYFNIHDYGRAHNSQLKALSIKRDYSPSWKQRGRTFIKERNYRAAIIELEIAIKYDSTDFESYYLKGIAEGYMNFSKDALESFYIAQMLVDKNLSKKLTDIWLQIGNTYLILEDYKSSEDAYLEALKIDPEFIQTSLSLGIVYTMINSKISAFNYFEKADKLQSHKLLVLLYKGLGFINLNLPVEAQKCFNQIILSSGGKILGNVGMGFLSVVNNNWNEAPHYFNEASIVFDTEEEFMSYIQDITKYIKPGLLEEGWFDRLNEMLELKLRQ